MPRPTFEFKSDESFVLNWGGTDKKFNTYYYTVSGNKITFNERIAFDHSYFTYAINGNVLILTRKDDFKTANGSYTENTTITLDRK